MEKADTVEPKSTPNHQDTPEKVESEIESATDETSNVESEVEPPKENIADEEDLQITTPSEEGNSDQINTKNREKAGIHHNHSKANIKSNFKSLECVDKVDCSRDIIPTKWPQMKANLSRASEVQSTQLSVYKSAPLMQ